MLTDSARAPIRESDYPRLLPDVNAWLFFERSSRSEEIYIVGSISADRYLRVPASKLPAIRSFMKRLDGSRTVDRIESELLHEEGLRLDVRALHRKFRRAGLLAGSHGQQAGDIEGVSATPFRLPIDGMLRALRHLSFLAIPAVSAGTAVICAALVMLLANPSLLSLMAHADAWERSFLRNAGLATAVVILSVAAHELSHCFAAAAWGIERGTVKMQLYLGVIPLVGLKLGGLYTLPPRARIAVWGAGIYTNLCIVATGIILLRSFLPGSPWLQIAISFNWVVAVFNLLPLLPTDGYFMLSTLTKDANVRMRAWAWLRRPFRAGAQRPSWFVLAYVVATLWLLGSTFWGLLKRAVNMGSNYPLWQSALSLLALALFVFMLWKNLRKREEFD